MQRSLDINIFVVDLKAYNEGHLHGDWIDATKDLDEIKKLVRQILETSPVEGAEEYAIHDYEGFGNYDLNENEGLEHAHQIACFIEEHGQWSSELINHYGDLEEAEKAVKERYAGWYFSRIEFLQKITEDTTNIPEHLKCYIDYCIFWKNVTAHSV